MKGGRKESGKEERSKEIKKDRKKIREKGRKEGSQERKEGEVIERKRKGIRRDEIMRGEGRRKEKNGRTEIEN